MELRPCLPSLLYYHGKSYRNKTIATLKSNSYSRPISLCGKDVKDSCDGWLVLQQMEYFTLWNPYTLESIDLPPLKLGEKQKIEYYVLLSGSSVLLLFESTTPSIFHCPLRCDDRRWTEIRYGKEMKDYNNTQGEDDYDNSNHHLDWPVSCNGMLYARTKNSKLLRIEIVESDEDDGAYRLVITELARHYSPSNDVARSVFSKTRLLECDGELFAVVIVLGALHFNEVIAVHVFKLNLDSTDTWEEVEVDSNKDRCFFVSCARNQNFCLSNVQGKDGNLVYFTKEDEKYLYCYNMEDNSCSVSLPCPNLPTPWLTPLWVMPTLKGGEKLTREEENPGNNIVEEEEILTSANYKETHISDLGLDVVNLISKKLFLTDYMNLRASCRLGRLGAPPRTISAEDIDINCLSAWLVFPTSRNIWSFVVPNLKANSRYMITTPELLQHATIQSSKDGWLLVSSGLKQRCMVFFNPFTKSLIQLPDLQTEPWVGFTFLSSPTSDDYLVVGISWWLWKARLAIFRPGYDEWRVCDFENNLNFWANNNNPVYWNGCFYFLGRDGNLGVLTEIDNNWEWEVLDKPKPPCNAFRQNFLVEFGGELISVFVGYMGRRVDVFKLNPSSWVWQKVGTLGNNVLFISHSSSFSMPAKIQGMGNRIYFPRVRGDSPVFYSLNTCRFHSFGSEDSLIDYCGTKEQLLCGWIEPKWHRL